MAINENRPQAITRDLLNARSRRTLQGLVLGGKAVAQDSGCRRLYADAIGEAILR